jgi:hypothetical protein
MASRTSTTAKPTAADRLRADQELTEVDTTQPLDQHPTSTLAKVDTNGAHTAALSSVQAGVRMVENQRRHHLLAFESDTWHNLAADLAAAERALTDDQLVDPEVIRRLLGRVEGWAIQRGLNGDGS